MKAVITADIINSTKSSSNSWIVELKKALKNFGKEYKNLEILISKCLEYSAKGLANILNKENINRFSKHFWNKVEYQLFDADKVKTRTNFILNVFKFNFQNFNSCKQFIKLLVLKINI